MIDFIKSLYMPKETDIPERRYDLDWLRVFAFALLIIYHVGMMYVANWNWHIKSQYTSDNLAGFMLLINPWRMSILWLISGVAIKFLLVKISIARLVGIRTYRLLLPLLFSILIIIPPQLYFEMSYNGDFYGSYWDFYSIFFEFDHPAFQNYQSGIWPHIDVNHLWYLRELWLFSLVTILIIPILNSNLASRTIQRLGEINGIITIFILIIPLFLMEALITNGEDSLRKATGFYFFILGYLLGWNKVIWERLKKNCRLMLVVAMVCSSFIVYYYYNIYVAEEVNELTATNIFTLVIYSLCRLSWVLALLGFSYQCLNFNSKLLVYFNSGVYPFYIVHQSIIIIAGYSLTKFNLGGVSEFFLVLIITFVGCFFCYEVARRIEFLKPFFGLKFQKTYSLSMQKIWTAIMIIVLTPFALEILL